MQTEVNLCDETLQKMALCKLIMGRVQCSSFNHLFSKLEELKNVPNQNFMFQVDTNKISTAISFLHKSLVIKPGIIYDIVLVENLFKDIPVYESEGGKPFNYLNLVFDDPYSNEEREVMNSFADTVKVLIKCSESKDGLLANNT